MIQPKSSDEIKRLREGGRILAAVLRTLAARAAPGVELRDLDTLARDQMAAAHARPAFLGYRPEGALRPYPASICTSVNETVVHGLPSCYVLKEGDLLKIDLGVLADDLITDAAISVGIGKITGRTRKLVETTESALKRGIEACLPGNHLGDIGYAVQRTADQAGFSVVQGLTGHGVGFALHEEPTVLNYGKPGAGMELVPGLVLAIEPMISMGSGEIEEEEDGSFRTRDGSVTAHVEHTVAITEHGPEILTLSA